MGMQVRENSGNRKKLVRNAILTIVMSFLKAIAPGLCHTAKKFKMTVKVFLTTAVRKVRTKCKLKCILQTLNL